MKIDASTLAVILNGYLAPVIIVAYDRIAESNSQMRVVALLPPMNPTGGNQTPLYHFEANRGVYKVHPMDENIWKLGVLSVVVITYYFVLGYLTVRICKEDKRASASMGAGITAATGVGGSLLGELLRKDEDLTPREEI